MDGVGNGLTVTVVVADAVHPRLLVAITVYVPLDEVVAVKPTGSSTVATKLFGPVQVQFVTLLLFPEAVKLAFKLMVLSTQTGLLAEALTVGTGFTVI